MNALTPPPVFTGTRQVAFCDTDAAGVAHFARLLCFVESVEHDCLRHLGLPVFTPDCGWPRVHLQADYHAPAPLGAELTVAVTVEQIGTSSLHWRFAVRHGQCEVLDGRYVTVRVGRGGKKQALSPQEVSYLISYFSNAARACK